MLLIKYLNPLYHARLYEKSVCGGGRLLIFGIHIFVKGKSTYSHYYCPVGLHSVLRLSEYRFFLFVCLFLWFNNRFSNIKKICTE